MSSIKKTLTFSLGTFFSRITGLVRDVILAKTFGASSTLDAYYVSIVFPFFLRRTFAEGAMSSAFLAIYKKLENEEEKEQFTSAVLTSLGLVTLVIVFLSEVFPYFMASIFATGADEEVKSLAADLIRLTAPFITIVFVWAVFYSVHNASHRYFLPALTPMFSNVGVMVGCLFGDIRWAAAGFTIGGLAALLVLLPFGKFQYRPTFKGLGEFYRLFFGTFMTMAVSQITTLIDVNVASFLDPGSLSLIQLSSRLYQLPLGIFGVAVSTVALSTLSESEGNFHENLKDFIDKSLFLTLPSSIGLMVLSERIISLLFGYGAFTHEDVKKSAQILFMYTIGLCFVSLFNLLSRAYHASKEVRTPFFATLLVSAVNISLDVILGFTMGASGIALATSVSYIAGFVFLALRMKPSFDKKIFKISLASTVMGTVILLLRGSFKGNLGTVFLILIGVFVYVLLSKLLKIEELEEILKRGSH